MQNPFKYGSIVTNEAFCNRKQELTDVKRAMENGQRMFIYSERRFGKTSLVKRALQQLPKSKFITVYVDLWPTDSTAQFVTTIAKALSEASQTTAQKLLDFASSFFSSLRPKVTLSEDGKPQIEFGLQAESVSHAELAEVLNAAEQIAKQRKIKTVFVFDEFQQIANYDDELIERKLRSIIQTHDSTGYIFLGSRKHLLQNMFLTESRPLFRSATQYPLGPIATEHWKPFITEKFGSCARKISEEIVDDICERTQGHPFYTQHLCHALWEITPVDTAVNSETVQLALQILLGRENYAFTILWQNLTKNQKRMLKGLANEQSVQPFSAKFTKKYGLRSASNAQRAAETLMEHDIIEKENGSFIIIDRFFRLWILQL